MKQTTMCTLRETDRLEVRDRGPRHPVTGTGMSFCTSSVREGWVRAI